MVFLNSLFCLSGSLVPFIQCDKKLKKTYLLTARIKKKKKNSFYNSHLNITMIYTINQDGTQTLYPDIDT